MRRGAVLLAILLAACGRRDEGSAPQEPSPLAALEASMARGPGMDDPSWPDLVARAAGALFPGRGAGDGAAAASRHAFTGLATIAADVARSLLRGGEAERAAWAERDPESLAVHDAFLRAAGRGDASFRAWVEGEGTDLLRRRLDRLAAPPR